MVTAGNNDQVIAIRSDILIALLDILITFVLIDILITFAEDPLTRNLQTRFREA